MGFERVGGVGAVLQAATAAVLRASELGTLLTPYGNAMCLLWHCTRVVIVQRGKHANCGWTHCLQIKDERLAAWLRERRASVHLEEAARLARMLGTPFKSWHTFTSPFLSGKVHTHARQRGLKLQHPARPPARLLGLLCWPWRSPAGWAHIS